MKGKEEKDNKNIRILIKLLLIIGAFTCTSFIVVSFVFQLLPFIVIIVISIVLLLTVAIVLIYNKNGKDFKAVVIWAIGAVFLPVLFGTLFLILSMIMMNRNQPTQTDYDSMHHNGTKLYEDEIMMPDISDNDLNKPEELQIIDLSTVTDEEFNILFSEMIRESDDERIRVAILETSLRTIPHQIKRSVNELNTAPDYGGIVSIALSHEELLNIIIFENNPSIMNEETPLFISRIIVSTRFKMDEAYQTTDNRQMIINAYLKRYFDDFSINTISDLQNAIRFSWGKIYTSISFGEYNETDIKNLILLYEYLLFEYKLIKSNNSREIEEIELIINALKIVQIRLNEEPPSVTAPNTPTKDNLNNDDDIKDLFTDF
jgi:hypothetical protein